MNILSILGMNIYTLRNSEKLTQEELAEKASISRITLSSIERGDISPTLDTIIKIANALNVPIQSLLSEKAENYLRILHQPYDGTLGDILNDMLRSSNYKQLHISSAYAKFSGISRLKDSIEYFKNKGGKLYSFIGIDQQNTSYEALCMLQVLSEELYIVHNRNISHTFHPKVYMLDNNSQMETAWIAVGSNNLTSGGLYINYEASSINTLDLNNNNDKRTYVTTTNIFDRFKTASCLDDSIVLKITSIDDINELLENNYIKKEQEMNYSSKKMPHSSDSTENKFGTESFQAPNVDNDAFTNPLFTIPENTDEIIQTRESSTDNLQPNLSKTSPDSKMNMNIGDTFWFEMRKSTGGSRNILDLSSTAQLQAGSVKNTKYDIDQGANILGGVAFFGLDPSRHSITKDINVIYKGNTYGPSTILFADNNQSWRLQLKGSSPTDSKYLSQYGHTHFVNNILLFKKISDNLYELDTMPGNSLNEVKKSSEFYATNGISSKSKTFGKLN